MYLKLINYTSPSSRRLAETLRKSGPANIFNPSLHLGTDLTTIVFRGLPAGAEKPFHAFMLTADASGRSEEPPVSLSDRFSQQIGYPVCDPKLFSMGNACWMTFNTGHFERPNSIYIARLAPRPGPALKVELPDRADIEKNWGFFEQGGLLHALYSLDPLVILTEKARTETTIRFAQSTNRPAGWSRTPKLTIGTQPVFLPGHPDKLALIAHRRIYLRGKRVYTGRPVTVDLTEGQVRIGNAPWFHSFKALLGDRTRHNPNLLSCSYFSGLALTAGSARVAYGINDVDFGIADLPLTPWLQLAQGNGS